MPNEFEASNEDELVVNIRPESDIYGQYRRLAYKVWYAIAEFVDNSTGSFADNREQLKSVSNSGARLKIDIFYDRDKGTITIADDAFGMNLDEFKKSLQLGRNTHGPRDGSRHEFGYGMKTAACWFGPRWTVQSKQLGSDTEYSAELDIDKLRLDRPEGLRITKRSNLDPKLHYTRIHIEGLEEYGRIFVGKTLTKIRTELGSIYRRDIQSGDVEITFNGNVIEGLNPKPLVEEIPGGEPVTWSQKVDLVIAGKTLKGELRILPSKKSGELTGATHAGLHLFRRDRVVQGGPSAGWKPSEIFGAPNSHYSQRLYGELNCDDWPSSQTKDQIEFGPDQDELIDALKVLLIDWKDKILERRNGEPGSGIDKAAVDSLIEATREELLQGRELGAKLAVYEEGFFPEANPEETGEVAVILETLIDDMHVLQFSEQAYPTLHLGIDNKMNENEDILRLGFPNQDLLTMVVNLNHPFIKDFVGDSEEALNAIIHMFYVDGLVERMSRKQPTLEPGQLRQIKDQLLRTLHPIK
jgi:hypothetical protein